MLLYTAKISVLLKQKFMAIGYENLYFELVTEKYKCLQLFQTMLSHKTILQW